MFCLMRRYHNRKMTWWKLLNNGKITWRHNNSDRGKLIILMVVAEEEGQCQSEICPTWLSLALICLLDRSIFNDLFETASPADRQTNQPTDCHSYRGAFRNSINISVRFQRNLSKKVKEKLCFVTISRVYLCLGICVWCAFLSIWTENHITWFTFESWRFRHTDHHLLRGGGRR